MIPPPMANASHKVGQVYSMGSACVVAPVLKVAATTTVDDNPEDRSFAVARPLASSFS